MGQPWVYVVLLGIVCLVISWFVKGEPAGSAVLAKDIEDAMDLVAANLEQENKELLDSMSRMKSEYERYAEKLEVRIHDLEKRIVEFSAELRLLADNGRSRPGPQDQTAPDTVRETPVYARPLARTAAAPAAPPESGRFPAEVQAGVSDNRIRVRYPELFRLHDQGKSVDSIARKLEMNKGEVALILQLAKREEEGNV